MTIVMLQLLLARAAEGRGLWIGLVAQFSDHERHCTLVHLGRQASSSVVEGAIVAAGAIAPSLPVECRVGGVARFRGNLAEGDPVVLLLQQPRLRELRGRVALIAESRGARVSDAFDYTPHVTLRRAPKGELVEISDVDYPPLTFDRVGVFCGDARVVFPEE